MKKIAALLITVLMLMPLCISANAAGKKITDYSAGDIIEYGYYPQTKVTDSAIIAALTKKAGSTDSWTDYNYYSGQGSVYDCNISPTDFIKYSDIVYNGAKYRGVYFTKYRPMCNNYFPTADDSYQDDNGYYTNTEYWFKYEPIQWIVLSPDYGKVISRYALDAQTYSDYCEFYEGDGFLNPGKSCLANNYMYSSIREWLNDDFINLAFSESQQNSIIKSDIGNSAYNQSYSAYDSSPTSDKIFLLSYNEIKNTSYGYSSNASAKDSARTCYATDYTFSQGASNFSNYSDYYKKNVFTSVYWMLRSAGDLSYHYCIINPDGSMADDMYTASVLAVRPVFQFNTNADITNEDLIFSSEEDNTGSYDIADNGSGTDNSINGTQDTYNSSSDTAASTNKKDNTKMTIIILVAAAIIVVLGVAVALIIVFSKKNSNKPPVNTVPTGLNPPVYTPPVSTPPTPPVYQPAPNNFSFCTNCGTKIVPGNLFCTSCGNKVE